MYLLLATVPNEAGVIASCIYKPNSKFEALLSAGLYDNIKHKEAKQKRHCNDFLSQGTA